LEKVGKGWWLEARPVHRSFFGPYSGATCSTTKATATRS
jgi:hypothetical protein